MNVVSTFSEAEVLSGVLREMCNDTFLFLKSLYAQGRADSSIDLTYGSEDLRQSSTDEEMDQFARFYLPEKDFSAVAWKLSDVFEKRGPGTFANRLREVFLEDHAGNPLADQVAILEPREFRIVVTSDDQEAIMLFINWIDRIVGIILNLVDQELGLAEIEPSSAP